MAAKTTLKYIDLFAGCGGFSLGLSRAGLVGMFAIEKHHDAFTTLDANLRDHFQWPDWLTRKSWEINEFLIQHHENLRALRGTVDLIVGGPPCQGFSTAGKRQHDDSRNQLVTAYLAAVELTKPRAVVIENVRGFACKFKDGPDDRYSDMVVRELKRLGYADAAIRLFDLSKFGVPQRRRRVLIVATLFDAADTFLQRLEANSAQWLRQKGLPYRVTAKMALSDLEMQHGTTACPGFPTFKAGLAGPSRNRFQRWARPSDETGHCPDSHRYVNHTPKTKAVFQKLLTKAPRNTCINTSERLKYGLQKRSTTVLANSAPAPTVTSIPDDLIHYCEARVLTPRECARLQTFPDKFEFKGPYTAGGPHRKLSLPRYTQIGNAVPPLFAEQVGDAWKGLLYV